MAPVFQAAGAQQNSTGASVSVAWPTHLADDIGLVVIETSGNSATLTPPTGWAAVPGTPVTDVATTAGSKLHVWWKRAASSAEAAVATGAATDHIVAKLHTFRGCVTTGNPWDVTTTGTKTTASTTATVPSLTTTLDDTLITMIVGRPNDNASTTHFGVPVNAGLTGLAEASEAGTTSGNGGGFVVSYGIAATAGSTGTSTLTKLASTTDTYVVLALKSPLELIANPGNFTLSGTTTGLLETSVIHSTTGTFSFVGNDVDFSKSVSLNVDAGTFTLAGTTTGLLFQRNLIQQTGLFTLSGNNTLLQQSLRLNNSLGQFNLSGNSTPLNFNRTLNQQLGTYLINGVSVDLDYQQNLGLTLDVSTGAFIFTGNSVGLNYQRTLEAQLRSFSVNTTTLGLIRSVAINAIPGTFTVAGNQASIGLLRTLDITTGGFAVVAANLGLNKLFTLQTTNGQFNLTGQDILVSPLRVIDAQVQSFSVFNLPAQIVKNYPLTGSNSTFTLNGSDLSYFANRNLKASTGQLEIYGQDGSNLFTYITNKPTILPKATPTKRNQWVYGRFTHMGRRFL